MNLRQHNLVLISFINNCLFNMHMFNIQHQEHVQICHDSYIRKPHLSGNFLGNEGVRINEVSLYVQSLLWTVVINAKEQMSLTTRQYNISYGPPHLWIVITGYNQSVTGCGSQRRQGSCNSTKTHVNSMILILRLNLTSLRNIYIKSGLRWAPHSF